MSCGPFGRRKRRLENGPYIRFPVRLLQAELFSFAQVAEQSNVAHYIEDECVSCGLCTDVCPETCICEGEDVFVIDPDRCTDCGDCVNVCPVECIIRVTAQSAA